jgi:predicted dehydrogenase
MPSRHRRGARGPARVDPRSRSTSRTERADALIAALPRERRHAGVFFQDRFAPDLVKLKRALDDGALGKAAAGFGARPSVAARRSTTGARAGAASARSTAAAR